MAAQQTPKDGEESEYFDAEESKGEDVGGGGEARGKDGGGH